MPKQQTFAQYLISKILPKGVEVTKPIDKSYMEELLKKSYEVSPGTYGQVVMGLKNLGDKLSTWEASTFGLDEISVPNKTKRNRIINKYTKLINSEKDADKQMAYMGQLQSELAKNDLAGEGTDDATLMVNSAMGGQKTQLMKLRTSPGVVAGAHGVVPEVFNKSYAEGVDPLHYWLGAAESRKNLAQGQVSTSAPGELGKVLSNVLNSSVVSVEDCDTHKGIMLLTRDDDVVGRHLARSVGGYKRNTLVSSEVQQDLLKKGIKDILVRSPQTCQAKDNTVCSLCMGLRPGTGKAYRVGDNAGMITAGSLAEPLTQMSLSAKHSTSFAKKEEGLTGEKGFRKFIEMPKTFKNKKILCEIYGKVYRIRQAPQGGKLITIRQTRKVPERYIVEAKPTPNMDMHFDYYVPPNLEIVKGIKADVEVYPGMELSTGLDNIRDVARLRGLGVARSMAAQGMYDIYKNTGKKMSRVHFELLARNAHPYVKIEKAPASFPFRRGEVVEYNQLERALSKMIGQVKAPADALGMTLVEGVLDITAGTEITEQIVAILSKANIKTVKVTADVETSPATTPMTRLVNEQQDWLAAMNHRYLKNQVRDAAVLGKKSNLHGYNPISSYAYGLEMRQDEVGRY